MFGKNESGKARRFMGSGERVGNFQSPFDQTPKREPNKQTTGFVFNQKKNDSFTSIPSNRLNNSMFSQTFDSPRIKPREKIILPQFKKVSSEKTLNTSLNNSKPIHQDKYSGFQVSPLVRLASVDKPVFYPKERQGVKVWIAPPDPLRERLSRSFIEPRSDRTDYALETSIHEASCLEFLRKKRKYFGSQDNISNNISTPVRRDDEDLDDSQLKGDEEVDDQPVKRRKVDGFTTPTLNAVVRKRPALRSEEDDVNTSTAEDGSNMEVKKRRVATSPLKIWDSSRNPIEVSHLSMKKFLERKAHGPNVLHSESSPDIEDMYLSKNVNNNEQEEMTTEEGQAMAAIGDKSDTGFKLPSFLETSVNDSASKPTRKLGGHLSLRNRLASSRLDSPLNTESSEQTVREGVTWKDLNEDRKRMYSKLTSLFGEEETEDATQAKTQTSKFESSLEIKSTVPSVTTSLLSGSLISNMIAQSNSTFAVPSNSTSTSLSTPVKLPDITKESNPASVVPEKTGFTFPASDANKGFLSSDKKDNQNQGGSITLEKQPPVFSSVVVSSGDGNKSMPSFNPSTGKEDANGSKPSTITEGSQPEVKKSLFGDFKSPVASSTLPSVAPTPVSSTFNLATAPAQTLGSSNTSFNFSALTSKQDPTKDIKENTQPSSKPDLASSSIFPTSDKSKSFAFTNSVEPQNALKVAPSTVLPFQGLTSSQQQVGFSSFSANKENTKLSTSISSGPQQSSLFSVTSAQTKSTDALTSSIFTFANQQPVQSFLFGPSLSTSTKSQATTTVTASNHQSNQNFTFGSQPVKSNLFGMPKNDSSDKQQSSAFSSQAPQSFSFAGIQSTPAFDFGAQKTQSMFGSSQLNKGAVSGTTMTSASSLPSSSFAQSSLFTSNQIPSFNSQPQQNALAQTALQGQKNLFGGVAPVPNGNMFQSVVNSQPSGNPFTFQNLSSNPTTTTTAQVSVASAPKPFQFGGSNLGGSNLGGSNLGGFNFGANTSAIPEKKPNSQFTAVQPNKGFDFSAGSNKVSSFSVASSQAPAYNSGINQVSSFDFGATQVPPFGASAGSIPAASFNSGTSQSAFTFGANQVSSTGSTFGAGSLFNSGTTQAPSFNFPPTKVPTFGASAPTGSTQALTFNSGTSQAPFGFGSNQVSSTGSAFGAGSAQASLFSSGTTQASPFNFPPNKVSTFGASAPTGSTQALTFNSGTSQAPFGFASNLVSSTGSTFGTGSNQAQTFNSGTGQAPFNFNPTPASSFGSGPTQIPSFGASGGSTQTSSFTFGSTQASSFSAGPTQIPTFGANTGSTSQFNAGFPANNASFTLGTGSTLRTPIPANRVRRRIPKR